LRPEPGISSNIPTFGVLNTGTHDSEPERTIDATPEIPKPFPGRHVMPNGNTAFLDRPALRTSLTEVSPTNRSSDTDRPGPCPFKQATPPQGTAPHWAFGRDGILREYGAHVDIVRNGLADFLNGPPPPDRPLHRPNRLPGTSYCSKPLHSLPFATTGPRGHPYNFTINI
jgi:hypothetical protein